MDRPNVLALRVPQDPVLFFIGIAFYAVLYPLFSGPITNYLIRTFSRVPDASISRPKFTRALWKAVCYSALAVWATYTLYGEQWKYSPFEITLIWKDNITPWQANVYYVLETVYYTGSFFTMFLEERQSDFSLMILHHITTLSLVSLSYCFNFIRYGVFIMMLHDIGDPFMEVAKVFVYLGFQKIGDFFFALFAVFFIVPRIIIYFFMILLPGARFLTSYGGVLCPMIFVMLLSTFFLNLYWSCLILKMATKFLSQGRVEKDIRDAEPGSNRDQGRNVRRDTRKRKKKGTANDQKRK